MALRIWNNTIYSSDGEKLKDIKCPRSMMQSDLVQRTDKNFDCSNCMEVIVNTDWMSEQELVSLLKAAPRTCLFINLANPLFEVVD